jgi:hypothetical protein
MTLAKAKATTYTTFTVQASLTIVTNDRQNIFILDVILVSVVLMNVMAPPQPQMSDFPVSKLAPNQHVCDKFQTLPFSLRHSGANVIKLFTAVIYEFS